MNIVADGYSSRVRPVLTGRVGAVSTAHPLATAAGQEILLSGGNAVDAMIAAQAVLTVIAPDACGLGGDMLALVHNADGAIHAANGTGCAPSALGEVTSDGGASVTVPGIVSGWAHLTRTLGRLPLERVLRPASSLARAGFPLSTALGHALDKQRERLVRNGAGKWPLLSLRPGDLVVQNDLAMMLDRIGKEGESAFYRGEIAEAIVSAVRAQGGALSAEDLERHRVEIEPPVATPLGSGTLYVQPPMSQGILLAMTAKALATHRDGPREHARIEVTDASFAYRDRAGEGEDLLAIDLPFDPDRASRRGGPRAYLHTAGVAVADRQGMVCSSLVSVFDDFGSGVYVSGHEFLLNNRAAGFTSGANAPAGGKRPVHTLAPALYDSPHGPLALATPGADGQVQTLIQVLGALVEDNTDLAHAIAQPRWRSENGKLLIEDDHPHSKMLAALGHDLVPLAPGDTRFGAVVAAGQIGGRPIACADWRRLTWAGVV